MIYTYRAGGHYSFNYATLGIKKFVVKGGLGNVLKAGTPITIKSQDQQVTMRGIIIYYDNESHPDAFVSVDIEKSNGDPGYYSENWILEVDDSLADAEVAAVIEAGYGKPIESAFVDGYTGRPYTPQSDSEEQPAKYVPRYIENPYEDPYEDPVEDPVEDPYEDPVENPYTPPVENPYTPPVENPYTPPNIPYTPPNIPYTPPNIPYTPPNIPYTPPNNNSTLKVPFYIKYKIPIIVLIVALIIGIIVFFVFKNKKSPVDNIIAAFGKIL
jgi:hypothetical protein